MTRKRLLPPGFAVAFAAGQPVLGRAGLIGSGFLTGEFPSSQLFAASNDEPGKHGTAKRAAAGAGHEIGHGRTGAEAASGALVGRHEKNR